ncbi:MAG: TrmH family RNA methyltransferase [Bacteroidia bacterium]
MAYVADDFRTLRMLLRQQAKVHRVYWRAGAHVPGDIHRLIRQHAIPLTHVPPKRLLQLVPQAKAFVVELGTVSWQSWESLPHPHPGSLWVGVEGVTDVGNWGAILRTTAAFAVEAVICSTHKSLPATPALIRASAGTLHELSLFRTPSWKKLISTFQAKGMIFVATDSAAPTSVYEWDWKQPTCILIGSESVGLSPQVRQAADGIVAIPTGGKVASLNVAVALGGILTFVQYCRSVRG